MANTILITVIKAVNDFTAYISGFLLLDIRIFYCPALDFGVNNIFCFEF